MRKGLKLLCILILAVGLLAAGSLSAYGASIDPGKTSSLTLQYRHNGMVFEGLDIQVYRVAEVSKNGEYALTGKFKDYPVSLNGVTSQNEWKTIASTLSGFAASDGLASDYAAATAANGVVSFRNLRPGMYLTLGVKHEAKTEVTTFETFLTAIPHPSGNGSYNYDVTAYPKCSSTPVTPNMVEYKVVKLWKDSGFTQFRPEKIKVRIIKDGKVQEVQTLSSDNNWSYSWEAADDGSIWQASEIAITAGYTVTSSASGTTFILTNTYGDPDDPNNPDIPDVPVIPDVPDVPDDPDDPDEPAEPVKPDDPDTPDKPKDPDASGGSEGGEDSPGSGHPKTGDMTLIWPYVLAMCISGSMLLILAIWRMRSE